MKLILPVCALGLLFLFPPLSFSAENERTLTVRASSVLEAAPDMAVVTFAVETMAQTAKESAAENARVSGQVMKSVKSAIAADDEVDTSSYSVFPVYEYEKGRQVMKGFRTAHQVKFTTAKTASIGEILDKATNAGANRVVDVRFDMKDISGHCEGLIRSAAVKAASQARAAASAFGTGLDGVKTIMPSCGRESEGPIRPYAAEFTRMKAETQIEPGTVRLRADVEAVYFLEGER